MRTFLFKHTWFNNQKSDNYFLPGIHLPVVFSHFFYHFSSRKNRIYPKSTPDILKAISSAVTPVYYYFYYNSYNHFYKC